MSCYHDAADWFVTGRHQEHPEGWVGACPGCMPCHERHCTCRVHLDAGEYACPKCVGKVRSDLIDIERLMAAMPTEAVHRGVNSEAMMLVGPGADPEAWAWRRAAQAAREDVLLSSLEDADPHHPRTVLGFWEVAFREDYEQPTELEWTLSRCVDYLTGRLTTLARDDEQDFPAFAREVRTCQSHLEVVLHAGEQRDTGAPCMTCSVPLVRVWGADEKTDGWECPKCRLRSTEAQYRFAVQHLHREEASELTIRDMEIRTGITASTIRRWASTTRVNGEDVPPRIRSVAKDGQGRKLYRVEDVLLARGGSFVRSA